MPERVVSQREPGGPGGGMLCPVCSIALVMADKQGVEIDYCPKCRGIWLDRGEIDKIIARSLDQDAPRAAPYPAPAPAAAYPPQGRSDGGHGGDSHGGGGQRNRGGHGGGGYGGGGHRGGGHDGGGYGGGGHGGSHGTQGRRSWLRDLFD